MGLYGFMDGQTPQKGVTDLPAAAQAKLMDRSQAREALGGLSHLVDEDDEVGLI